MNIKYSIALVSLGFIIVGCDQNYEKGTGTEPGSLSTNSAGSERNLPTSSLSPTNAFLTNIPPINTSTN
jgi:hypothetical protein